jgi:hypothetical protein
VSRRASQSFSDAEVELLDAILRNVKRGRIADVIGLVKRHESVFEALVGKVAAMKRASAGQGEASAQPEQEAKAS